MNLSLDLLVNSAWLIMPILLAFEFAIVYAINPNYQHQIVDAESDVKGTSDKFRTHALTFSGMAFTVMAILLALSENPGQFVAAIRVLGVSIALLFFSYEVREVSETRTYWFVLQEKTLGYGFLSLFVGVVILYDTVLSNSVPWVVLVGFLIVAIIRFSTVLRQLRMLRNMAN